MTDPNGISPKGPCVGTARFGSQQSTAGLAAKAHIHAQPPEETSKFKLSPGLTDGDLGSHCALQHTVLSAMETASACEANWEKGYDFYKIASECLWCSAYVSNDARTPGHSWH